MTHFVRRLYSAEFDFPDRPGGPAKTIMIAAIPRSGSSLLCLEMWRTGLFGAPAEYLNLQNRDEDMIPRLGGGDLPTYWEVLQRKRTGPNGVFCFKTFPQDLGQVHRRDARMVPRISSDYVVFLRRRDKEAQAVSYSRAHQTNAWFAGVSEKAPAIYSHCAVSMAGRWITMLEGRWSRIFDRKGCSPLCLWYEDLAADPNGTIAMAAEFCELDVADGRPVALPQLEIQRDAVTEDWLERFRAG